MKRKLCSPKRWPVSPGAVTLLEFCRAFHGHGFRLPPGAFVRTQLKATRAFLVYWCSLL